MINSLREEWALIMQSVYSLTRRPKYNNTYILGEYTVSSSLVLFFSFFYWFASSVIFQTYSHLKKREQLIIGKMTCGYKCCTCKNALTELHYLVIIFVKARVISLEDISFLKVFTFIILNMFIKFLIRSKETKTKKQDKRT